MGDPAGTCAATRRHARAWPPVQRGPGSRPSCWTRLILRPGAAGSGRRPVPSNKLGVTERASSDEDARTP